jgi:PAS domain S-box-containing protein
MLRPHEAAVRDMSTLPTEPGQDGAERLRAEISRRTDAERHLEEISQRLRTLIDSANDAVITIDADSIVMDWNLTATRMFGWEASEILGRTLTDFIVPPVHRASHHHGMSHYLMCGEGKILNRRIETSAMRKNGEEFDVELSVWPVRVGDHWTFSSFVRDISRRKAAERALAESEARYRRVVENVNEGIIVTAGGRILYANPRSLELTGLDEETVKARPFTEFIHPEDREMVLSNHIRRLRGEQVEPRYHFRAIHVSGDIRWLETSAVMFEWLGSPATLNFLTDVTLKRQVEQDIRSALERERELSELKSRFVAVASHEFRTPLAAILSSVELLDDYGDSFPAEERKEILGLVKTAVKRMNGMVEQVLITSQLESRGFAFEPRPLPLPELLVQIAAEVDRANSRTRRITLACTDLQAMREVDERLLRHILANLLSNALKYSPPEALVRCTATGLGDLLELTITDQGIGIPHADIPHLFETFHRGTNVGNVQGTGIGLQIVKECVELHQGSISVDSTVDGGSTFRVRLHAPAVAKLAAPLMSSTAPAPAAKPSP